MLADFVPAPAVIVAVPIRVAVTMPVLATEMIPGSELPQVIVTPVIVAPAESLATAVSGVVTPTSLVVAPVIVTETTLGTTTTGAVGVESPPHAARRHPRA